MGSLIWKARIKPSIKLTEQIQTMNINSIQLDSLCKSDLMNTLASLFWFTPTSRHIHFSRTLLIVYSLNRTDSIIQSLIGVSGLPWMVKVPTRVQETLGSSLTHFFLFFFFLGGWGVLCYCSKGRRKKYSFPSGKWLSSTVPAFSLTFIHYRSWCNIEEAKQITKWNEIYL